MHNGTLTKKENDFLNVYILKTSHFYGLPNIHKSKEINIVEYAEKLEYTKILYATGLKYRFIVAGLSCRTSRHSKIIDILLHPFLHKIKFLQ